MVDELKIFPFPFDIFKAFYYITVHTRAEKRGQMRAALIMFVTQSTADANSF